MGLTNLFTDIANAVREKKGTKEPIIASDFPQEILSIESGEKNDGKYIVQVIDYDGAVLKQQNLDEGDKFVLPDVPLYTDSDNVVFQEWAYPYPIELQVDEEGKTYFIVPNSDIFIGATCTCRKGYNSSTGLSDTTMLRFRFFTSDKYARFSIHTNENVKITYIAGGAEKEIDIAANTDYNAVIDFRQNSIGGDLYIKGSFNLLGIGTTNTDKYLRALIAGDNLKEIKSTYNNSLSGVQKCRDLTLISLPKSPIILGSGAFYNTHSLATIVLPNSQKTQHNGSWLNKDYTFANCQGLKTVAGSMRMTSSDFNACLSLKYFNPMWVTGTNGFIYCSLLKRVSFTEVQVPYQNKTISSLKNLRQNTFKNCTDITIYDFSKCKEIPNLPFTNTFENINPSAKIIVPNDLVEQWRNKNNWTVYASIIYAENEIID